MPEADILPVIGNSKAGIQGSRKDSAACPSYPYSVLDADMHFIRKPFSIAALTAKVREVLDHWPASRIPCGRSAQAFALPDGEMQEEGQAAGCFL